MMNTWNLGIAIAATALVVAFAEPWAADAGADQRGRYEGVAAAANAVWVVDTHTGRVRKCTQDFADQAPACSAASN